MKVEGGLTEKTLQAAGTHVPHMHERHVFMNEGKDRFRFQVRDFQPPEDIFRQLFPFPDMAVKMDAGGVCRSCQGFTGIVEEHRPG